MLLHRRTSVPNKTGAYGICRTMQVGSTLNREAEENKVTECNEKSLERVARQASRMKRGN